MRGGRFLDGDPGELVDFVDRKVVHRGVAKTLVSRVEGVQIRPAPPDLGRAERKAVRKAWPHVSLHAPGLSRRHAALYLYGGTQVPPDQVPARLSAAGVTVPTRTTSGAVELEVPETATGAEVVELALAALRALGAGPSGWEWEPMIKQDTSPTG